MAQECEAFSKCATAQLAAIVGRLAVRRSFVVKHHEHLHPFSGAFAPALLRSLALLIAALDAGADMLTAERIEIS
jgi:hypothetical protein